MKYFEENWVVTMRSGDTGELIRRFDISPMLARILWSRGFRTEEAVDAYLYGGDSITWPQLEGANRFVSVMREAIAEGGRFRVIGDYDVDGVTGTYLAVTALRSCGVTVDYRIPDRVEDGYGISERMVREAADDGIKTIVTVDNGIAAIEQCALAKELGMRVVVTDHHEPKPVLPQTDCTIDPKASSQAEQYGNLCGAVVAAILMDNLLATYGMDGYCDRMIEVLAIATLCDVMDLTGIARDILRNCLRKPVSEWNRGLQALFEANELHKAPRPYDLGFVIGPCINALGRLETADLGVEMLMTDDPAKRTEYARRMVDVNRERKAQTEQYTADAIRAAEAMLLKEDCPVLVLYLPECHESIVGIVAGRVREKFNRPTIVLTDTAKDDGMVKGSARSIDSFHLVNALQAREALLDHFGGHAKAAGMSLKKENIEPLCRALAEEFVKAGATTTLKVEIDLVIPFSCIDLNFVSEIEQMEPFGNGNRTPLFATKNAQVLRISRRGTGGKIAALQLRDEQGSVIRGICFDGAEFLSQFEETFGFEAMDEAEAGRGTEKITVLYNIQRNSYNGESYPEIVIRGYRFG